MQEALSAHTQISTTLTNSWPFTRISTAPTQHSLLMVAVERVSRQLSAATKTSMTPRLGGRPCEKTRGATTRGTCATSATESKCLRLSLGQNKFGSVDDTPR